MATETTIDRRITDQDRLATQVAVADTTEPQTQTEEKPMPFQYNMDFRPKGYQGNTEGAAARQRARIKQLERAGRGILLKEAVTTNLVIINTDNGGYKFELVRPGAPIPEYEMTPGVKVDISRPAPSGVFTPLEPTGRSYSFKVNPNKAE